jgi:glycosyltransferase involved in cell wall biosynthesis
MKVLHLPTVVGGMAWGLAQGEKKLGLDSQVLVTSNLWMNYPCDTSLHWEKKGALGVFLSSLKAFWGHRRRFDVYHFNFGSTLVDFRRLGIHHWDLAFYGKGKKIFTYNGCDARQKYKTMRRAKIAACHEPGCYGDLCASGARDKMKERRIRKVSRYAHHLFAVNPDLLHFLPASISSFLPYCVAYWDEISALPYQTNREITVVHAPTDRTAKGTDTILAALENLKRKYPLRIVLVERRSHAEALDIYRQADLVIDQVLVGWYGSVAVEAMKMGKPVAVYIREEDLSFIPEPMAKDLREAVIQIDPFSMEAVLEEYLQNPKLLSLKSEAGQAYVHRWHDPLYVASLTKAVYES